MKEHGSRTRDPPGVIALRSALLAASLATLAVLALHLASDRPAALGDDWPGGTLVIARSESLARLLEQLQRLEGTPIAQRAAAIAADLPDCEWLAGRAEVGDVWSQLRCRTAGDELAGLERERGDADLAFALPPGEGGGRIVGRLVLSPEGDVAADVVLPKRAFASARALLLPGTRASGPPLLRSGDALVHARLRPEGGIDVASLVPDDSQADQMFRLKSEIFAGSVLDGTWEVAIYPPAPGEAMPRAALAVGTALSAPAVAAMEDFLRDLAATWPVHRTAFAVGAAGGACLLDLNLLPELAPCYVATGSALVIGWNPESVRHALATASDAASAEGGGAREPQLRIDFAGFAAADAQLARLAGPDTSASVPRVYPWRRLTADGTPDGDEVHLRVRLERGAGA